MRSKIILVFSIALICAVAFLVYKGVSNKSLDDYVVDEESAFKTTVDNYSFYADDVTDNGAIDVSNMLSLLGVSNDVVVSEEYLSEDGDDFNRDLITMYSDDIDYSKPVYTVVDTDTYYVWTGVAGNIHGIHLDKNYELVELR